MLIDYIFRNVKAIYFIYEDFHHLDPIWIDISLFIGFLVESQNNRNLSLAFILPVNSGSLKRI